MIKSIKSEVEACTVDKEMVMYIHRTICKGKNMKG